MPVLEFLSGLFEEDEPVKQKQPDPSFMDYVRSVGDSLNPEVVYDTVTDAVVRGATGAYDYVQTTTPRQFAEDVYDVGSAIVRGVADNPVETVVDAIPLVGDIKAYGEDIGQAANLRAQGDIAGSQAVSGPALALAAAGIIPGVGEARKGGKLAALSDVRPPKENVQQVIAANTMAGKLVGETTRPLSSLSGGVPNSPSDLRRVEALVEEMSGPDGYIERLIVDDAGNVIEGQHRLEALRRLGVEEVPVVEYQDFEQKIPFYDMRDAALAAGGVHPDHANQIASQLAEIYADEGGDLAEVLKYQAPAGFEKPWIAAREKLTPSVTTSPATSANRAGDAGFSAPSLSGLRDFRLVNIDPSTYGLRKKSDLPRLQDNPATYELGQAVPETSDVSLYDYIGHPYLISMSDRTGANETLTRIGDVDLNFPVDLQGGQGFMRTPTREGLLWASDQVPVNDIFKRASRLQNETGLPPLFMPYRMKGPGSDFSTMTGEAMMSYAQATFDSADKASMNNVIRKYIPDFAGIDDPRGYEQFAQNLSGASRKKLQDELSDTFGETGGGLTLPMTRALLTDPSQIDQPSYFLQNVGVLDLEKGISRDTGHRTYDYGLHGNFLGELDVPVNLAELHNDLVRQYDIGDRSSFRGQQAAYTPLGASIKSRTLKEGQTLPKAGGTARFIQMSPGTGILDEATVDRIYGVRR